MNADELRTGLAQFHGSLRRAPLGPVFGHALLTEGVVFLVEGAECLWLITDAMAWVSQRIPDQNFDEFFLSLKLAPNADGSAVMTVSDGNHKVLYEHPYTATTFPLPEGIELWIEWGEGLEQPCWTVLLPSEH